MTDRSCHPCFPQHSLYCPYGLSWQRHFLPDDNQWKSFCYPFTPKLKSNCLMRHKMRFCHFKPLREPDTKVKSQLPKPVVRWQNIKGSNIDIFLKLDRPKVHCNGIVTQLYWLEESCALLSVDCVERGEEESKEESVVLQRQKTALGDVNWH